MIKTIREIISIPRAPESVIKISFKNITCLELLSNSPDPIYFGDVDYPAQHTPSLVDGFQHNFFILAPVGSYFDYDLIIQVKTFTDVDMLIYHQAIIPGESTISPVIYVPESSQFNYTSR